MSSPSFLFANENNHTLLQSLLEALNAMIEHQYPRKLNDFGSALHMLTFYRQPESGLRYCAVTEEVPGIERLYAGNRTRRN
jgi:hypothetical protein